MAEEFFELVWEDGQLLMRGLAKRTQKNPSCIGHTSPSSDGVHFKNEGDSTFPSKSVKFGAVDSILGESPFDNMNDFYLNLTHSDTLLDDKHLESLPELYQRPFNEFSEQDRGNRYDKLLKDSQAVPVHKSANLKTGYAYNDVPSQPEQFTLLQGQASAPRKSPRVNPSPNLASLGVFPSSKPQEQVLEAEMKRETQNFSLFLRSPVATSSQGFTRADELKNNGKTSGSGSFKTFELAPIVPAGNASKIAKGYQSQLSLEESNARLLPSIAKPPDKSLPDVQSEAVCHDDGFQSKRSPTHQVCGQTSSLLVNTVKRELTTKKSIEPPVASSSCCSREASNNPTYTLKRRYEETDGSAYPSDENVEEKPGSVNKTVSDRGSKGKRKRRTPESHNLSERKRGGRIKKKMRALQDLIPNCNKVDKASMLDEAIEYLKSLQLQVQIMSMGTGVCMPLPMMLPTGMQQIHAPPMAHFSPLGVGMGMKMQMGVVCSSPQFLIPPIPGATAMPGLAENRIQMPGFPGLALPMFRPPLGLMHKTVPIAAVCRPSASTELVNFTPIINSKVSIQNVEVNNKTLGRSKTSSFRSSS